MQFNQREWVTDIITSTVSGAAAGVLAALVLPDAFLKPALIGGVAGGLMAGLINLPFRWVVERRPRPDDPPPK